MTERKWNDGKLCDWRGAFSFWRDDGGYFTGCEILCEAAWCWISYSFNQFWKIAFLSFGRLTLFERFSRYLKGRQRNSIWENFERKIFLPLIFSADGQGLFIGTDKLDCALQKEDKQIWTYRMHSIWQAKEKQLISVEGEQPLLPMFTK